MNDPFFLGRTKKRKSGGKKKRRDEDEEISEDELGFSGAEEELKNQRVTEDEIVPDEDLENDEETAAEKRIRLAQKYLKLLEQQKDEEETNELDAEKLDRDLIAERLKTDVLEIAGKRVKKIADTISSSVNLQEIQCLRGHLLPITVVVVSEDDQFIFSASKDCSIIKWSLITAKKEFIIHGGKKDAGKHFQGHTGHILGLAVSSDGLLLASCGTDQKICVWEAATGKHLRTFQKHRDIVTGVCFRKNTHQLYSVSHDRMIKLWNLDEMGYMDTLFGHQDHITAVDALYRERCVTSGGRDKTIRIWKIVEESQLVFKATTQASIDCVKYLNDELFISGADDGSLSLWNITKRKPTKVISHAHGSESHWIISIASYPYSDLFASGSSDGFIRLWKVTENPIHVQEILSIPMEGFVNSMAFTNNARHLVVGLGQEHRLGRWTRIKTAKNCIKIIPLKQL